MLSAINQHSSECASTNTFSDCSVDKGRQKWKAEIKKLYPESTAVLEQKDDCMICLMALRLQATRKGAKAPMNFLLQNLFASDDARILTDMVWDPKKTQPKLKKNH